MVIKMVPHLLQALLVVAAVILWGKVAPGHESAVLLLNMQIKPSSHRREVSVSLDASPISHCIFSIHMEVGRENHRLLGLLDIQVFKSQNLVSSFNLICQIEVWLGKWLTAL